MSAEPETTLAWAEFLWRVVKEAPEAASLYIALFLFWRHSREAKGRHLTLELSDSATASDSLTATIGTATETDTALPVARREGRDLTIRVPAATATAIASMPTPAILNLAPSRGTGSAGLALTTGTLDAMAELDPDFPQF